MIFYTTLNAARGAATQALYALTTTRPILSEHIDAVVAAAAYADHNDVTVISADSISAAVGTVMQSEGLLPRDGFLLDLLARVEQLELAVL